MFVYRWKQFAHSSFVPPSVSLFSMNRLFHLQLLRLLCLFPREQTNGIYQSLAHLSNLRTQFQPANTIEYLGLIFSVKDLQTCFEYCNLNIRCRTFTYDFSTLNCKQYEGLVETGSIIASPSPTSTVGDIDYSITLFTHYADTCDQCALDRYLQCSSITSSCDCPANTFWNSLICQNQLYYQSNYSMDNWCRQDLALLCVNSTCQCSSNAFWTGTICQPGKI